MRARWCGVLWLYTSYAAASRVRENKRACSRPVGALPGGADSTGHSHESPTRISAWDLRENMTYVQPFHKEEPRHKLAQPENSCGTGKSGAGLLA